MTTHGSEVSAPLHNRSVRSSIARTDTSGLLDAGSVVIAIPAKGVAADGGESPAAELDSSDESLLSVLSSSGVLPVYGLALLHYALQQLSLPLLDSYVNSRGWGSKHDLKVYGAAFLASVVVPFVCNPWVTKLQHRWGLRPTLLVVQAAAIAGFAVCALLDHRGAFIAGWALTGAVICLRTARQAAIAGKVPAAYRTQAISLHSTTNPLGSLVGVGVTRFIVGACGDCEIGIGSGLELNRYTLAFAASGVIAAVSCIVTAVGIDPPPAAPKQAPPSKSTQDSDDQEDPEDTVVRATLEDGTEYVTTPRKFQRSVLAFFCALVFFGSFVSNYFMVAIQPLLVNDLGYSDTAVANIFLISMAASVIPPVAIVPMSKCLSDKQIMVVGAVLKLAGGVLMAVPPLSSWRLVLGYVLVAKSTFFYFSCTISLFSKLLGKRVLGSAFGVLLSAVAAANAAATIGATLSVGPASGTWWLMPAAAPAAVSLLLLFVPWVPLDPAHPIVAKVAAI
eukprot:TRINITY_DN36118_c0_g1_i1.p1 TRINITY_DN36118_c0_g1~~TRINITY_DN36118_c0_g1_i1.p1  ORF type:complete len:506 (+),score=180.42 TRINITY_DN36118_c0_g1_i1:125-1642(+)